MRNFLKARPGLISLLLGAASALALPPLHLLPMLLLTFPAFLAVLARAGSARQALWWGALFGFGHHMAGLYWLTHALFTDIATWFWLVPFAAPGVALPLAAFMALPAWAAWRAGRGQDGLGWPMVLVFAAAWTASEMLRGVLFTGFPWNLLGTAWAFHEIPLQPAAFIGVHGLSLLTALLAALPALGWRVATPLLLSGLALWGSGGAWVLRQPAPEDNVARVVLVQGNIPQDLKWEETQRLAIFQRYLQLTREGTTEAAQAAPEAPILAIWPETASPFLLAQDADAQRLAASVLPERGVLLAGTARAEWTPEGRIARLWNSLVSLDAAGTMGPAYDKSHLVPFGEYMPLRGLIPIRMVTGGMDFTAGPGRQTLELPGIPGFSPLICYEVIFPGRVTGPTRPGWLLNITNDAWFGHSAGPYQHLAASRLRAVEEGLPLVRAAQTGISIVYDARGRERARIGLGETGFAIAPLPGAGAPTPFSRWGLWLPLGGLLCLGMLGVALRRRRAA
ncbi:MAG TPA: apolipoprotein N-acyltransferase [Roseococcus sp.]|jgi:apolipoprotein N-acyltransferase|nr:apolipoprotein N-acyltransferase [Roseococcus sp.]